MAADGRILSPMCTPVRRPDCLPRRSTSCANQRWIDCRVNTPPLSRYARPDPFARPREAAPHVRLSDRTLERYRVTGEGPEFLKIGRLVFYEQSSLDEWLKLKRRRSTSDPGPPPKRH